MSSGQVFLVFGLVFVSRRVELHCSGSYCNIATPVWAMEELDTVL